MRGPDAAASKTGSECNEEVPKSFLHGVSGLEECRHAAKAG